MTNPVQPLLLLLFLTATTTITATSTTPRPCPAADIPPAPTTTTSIAAAGASDLGMRLLQNLVEPITAATAQNTLISPYSIWMVLTLAYIGSEGNTERELREVLGLTQKTGTTALLKQYETSVNDLSIQDTMISLDSATRLYVDDQLSLACCQVELADQLVTLDLNNETELAARTINDFVNSTTEGLIPTIIDPTVLDGNTQMVAVGAVYFKGAWRYPFKAERTKPEPFHLLGGQEVMVDMMAVGDVWIGTGTVCELQAKIVQLPYSTGLVNMTILLPRDDTPEGFRTTLNSLNLNTLRAAWAKLDYDIYEITLPKFEVRSEFAEDMKSTLKTLGVQDLFSEARANLTSYNENLFVKHFIHKTVVKVDEEGTEAAGATAGVFVSKIRRSVRIDSPFIYLIHDSETIFFIGTYMKPEIKGV